MKIANIELGKYPLVLAPMEDVTDHSFRLLCRQKGADLVYSEFVSADCLIHNIQRTQQKLSISKDERPVVVQIYGRDPEYMERAAQLVAAAKPDIIDINFGCPVRKIANKGSGAGLLRDIPKLLEICQRVVKAVDIPVTAKTRLGWDHDNRIIVDLAERMQDTGIQGLAIHGRTRCQMYKGEADWTLIGEVKNNPRMHIPIIGNGDIDSPQLAKQAFDRYGVDAVMIGRATIGYYWIFEEIKYYLEHNQLKTPYALGEQIDLLRVFFKACVDWLGERRGILHARRHFAVTPALKSLRDIRDTRIKLLRASTAEEVYNMLQYIQDRWEEEAYLINK